METITVSKYDDGLYTATLSAPDMEPWEMLCADLKTASCIAQRWMLKEWFIGPAGSC